MFEPRGHDVMSGSILYPPTRADCDIGDPVHRGQRLPADVRPRHDRHGDHGDRERAGDARDEPGALDARCAGRAASWRDYAQKGRFVDSVRIPNVPSYLAADGCADRRAGARRARASTSPMAAISTPSSSRRRIIAGLEAMSAGDDPAAVARSCAGCVNEAIDAGASRGRDDPRRQPRHVDRQAARQARPRPQRGVLRRQGDRPLALRHRHLGAHGAARRARASSRPATTSCTRASSAPCSTAASRRGRRSATSPRSSRASPAGRGMHGHNTIFVDPRDPFCDGFQVV